MPIIKSAKKQMRHSRRNKLANDKRRSAFREAIKAFRASPTQKLLQNVFSTLDRAVDNQVIHANRAARLKSNLSKLLSK
ncbi:MAG: 30S ribosomal protein S20 [Patescibacteria group bacterium]